MLRPKSVKDPERTNARTAAATADATAPLGAES